ncbi:Cilia- and flagella-associated protein 36 [Amphibalanus amphitrite]|uniref:Cilia- and flagella-associated protein 36 n=1 Tax=Amphibalanus amphitrite TaxID=1232801 RepID=A0A6A4WFX6_AMPAM|nr:Cilia- and flagella-associated protein 36 [Amphibalanus amphitrite]
MTTRILVDLMLGSYMEDIGITPEQFEKACSNAAAEMKSKFHQLQFEQLWAADDFNMFQRMMIRTNIELQLQALELLQHRHGVIPASFLPGDVSEQERRILEEVTRRSLEDQGGSVDGDTRALEEAIVSTEQTKQQLRAGRDREQEIINSTMKLSVS